MRFCTWYLFLWPWILSASFLEVNLQVMLRIDLVLVWGHCHKLCQSARMISFLHDLFHQLCQPRSSSILHQFCGCLSATFAKALKHPALILDRQVIVVVSSDWHFFSNIFVSYLKGSCLSSLLVVSFSCAYILEVSAKKKQLRLNPYSQSLYLFYQGLTIALWTKG